MPRVVVLGEWRTRADHGVRVEDGLPPSYSRPGPDSTMIAASLSVL